MRILMLGNSFTYYHDMPKMLQAILGAEVVSNTKGGAWLRDHLDPQSELSPGTLKALREEKWDYVILQEQSKAPVFAKKTFHNSVRELCALARAAGAKPLLYATWAYRDGSEKLAETGLSYLQMDAALYESYHEAAKENDALIADVGKAFLALHGLAELYEDDDYHPSAAGSLVAAETIARAIEMNEAAK